MDRHKENPQSWIIIIFVLHLSLFYRITPLHNTKQRPVKNVGDKEVKGLKKAVNWMVNKLKPNSNQASSLNPKQVEAKAKISNKLK